MSKRQRVSGNLVLCDTDDVIANEVDEVQNRIRERAFQISLDRNHAGREIDDWLSAESEVMMSPPVEIAEKEDALVVTLPAAGIDPQRLKIFATRDQILVRADFRHDHEPGAQIHVCEFRSRTLFRSIRLPASIDLRTLETKFVDGMLRISAKRERANALTKGTSTKSARKRSAAQPARRPRV